MKKNKPSTGVKKPTVSKKTTNKSPKKSLARTDEPKDEKAKRAAFKRDQAKIDELRTQIEEVRTHIEQGKLERAQRMRMRLEADFARMIRDEIYGLLNDARVYLMDIHPDLTGKPVAEALKEVLLQSFCAVDAASLFTNTPEIRRESLAYFQRILERERKRSAAEIRRANKRLNSHAFRSFLYDVILCALYLKKHGWKRHWLHFDFPRDFKDPKNKNAWQIYLRNLVFKCAKASPQEYPMPQPEIEGYLSSRFYTQVKPAIEEIFSLDEKELARRMDQFVFWRLEFFVTKGRSPAWKVLAEMFPGCD